jgi:hypothetical protein
MAVVRKVAGIGEVLLEEKNALRIRASYRPREQLTPNVKKLISGLSQDDKLSSNLLPRSSGRE